MQTMCSFMVESNNFLSLTQSKIIQKYPIFKPLYTSAKFIYYNLQNKF